MSTKRSRVGVAPPVDPGVRFTNEEAAQYLRIAPSTLRDWRYNRRYFIPFLRIGDCVFYRKRDLDAWINSRLVTE